MAALISSHDLHQAWTETKIKNNSTRMNLYADILFSRLHALFLLTSDEIKRRMIEKIRSSTTPKEFNVPVFTYRSRVIDCDTPREERQRLETIVAANHWHWTLQTEGDRFPVSHYAVFRYTDICKRLSNLFCANTGPHYWVTWRYVRPVSEGEIIVGEYELVLNYYPEGLPAACQRVLEELPEEPAPPAVNVTWTEDRVWTHVRSHSFCTPPRKVTMAPPPPPELLRHRRAAGGDEPVRNLAHECYCCFNDDDESVCELRAAKPRSAGSTRETKNF